MPEDRNGEKTMMRMVSDVSEKQLKLKIDSMAESSRW